MTSRPISAVAANVNFEISGFGAGGSIWAKQNVLLGVPEKAQRAYLSQIGCLLLIHAKSML